MSDDSASGNRWEPVPANRPADPAPSEGPQPPARIARGGDALRRLGSRAGPRGVVVHGDGRVETFGS